MLSTLANLILAAALTGQHPTAGSPARAGTCRPARWLVLSRLI